MKVLKKVYVEPMSYFSEEARKEAGIGEYWRDEESKKKKKVKKSKKKK